MVGTVAMLAYATLTESGPRSGRGAARAHDVRVYMPLTATIVTSSDVGLLVHACLGVSGQGSAVQQRGEAACLTVLTSRVREARSLVRADLRH